MATVDIKGKPNTNSRPARNSIETCRRCRRLPNAASTAAAATLAMAARPKLTKAGLKAVSASLVNGKVPPKITTPVRPSSSPSVSRDMDSGPQFRFFRSSALDNLLGHSCREISFGPVCDAAKARQFAPRQPPRFVLKHAPCRSGFASASWSRAHLSFCVFDVGRGSSHLLCRRPAVAPQGRLLDRHDRAVGQNGEGRRRGDPGRDPRLPGDLRRSGRGSAQCRAPLRYRQEGHCRLRGLCRADGARCAVRAAKTARCWTEILDGLFYIAKADGVLHEREGDFLQAHRRDLQVRRRALPQHPRPPRQSRRRRSLSRARRRTRPAVRRAAAALPQAGRRQPSRPADRARRAGGVHRASPTTGSPRSTPPGRRSNEGCGPHERVSCRTIRAPRSGSRRISDRGATGCAPTSCSCTTPACQTSESAGPGSAIRTARSRRTISSTRTAACCSSCRKRPRLACRRAARGAAEPTSIPARSASRSPIPATPAAFRISPTRRSRR